jgi:hypothetical protein
MWTRHIVPSTEASSVNRLRNEIVQRFEPMAALCSCNWVTEVLQTALVVRTTLAHAPSLCTIYTAEHLHTTWRPPLQARAHPMWRLGVDTLAGFFCRKCRAPGTMQQPGGHALTNAPHAGAQRWRVTSRRSLVPRSFEPLPSLGTKQSWRRCVVIADMEEIANCGVASSYRRVSAAKRHVSAAPQHAHRS